MKKLFNSNDAFVIAFKSQQGLENALDIFQMEGQNILDIQSTHYINIKKLKETRKPVKYGIIAGISGAVGFVMISLLIFYIMSKPQLMFGNKGTMPFMAYIPVLFTISILFSGLGLLLAFSIRNHLLPGQQNQLTDARATSENYILIIQKKMSIDELEKMISGLDYENIFEHLFIEQNIMLPLPLKVK